MSENVVNINSKDIYIESDSKVKIQNKSLKEGQIILIEDDGNINNAYKITKIDGEFATVEKPELSEIYNSVDLYKEGKIDFNKLKINKDAEVEIEKNIKESGIYKFLSTEVYAADDVSPKITFTANGNKMEILLRWNWRLRYRNSFNRNIFGYVIIHDKDESVRLSVI